jgi:hypothetical protein
VPPTALISPNPNTSPPSALGSEAVALIAPGPGGSSARQCPSGAYGNIYAAEGTGSGTRTAFLDAEQDPAGH